VVGSLFLFGPPGNGNPPALDRENARLAPGKYLLKAFVDSRNRLADDPTRMLAAEDFRGQVEIDAEWGEGFPAAEKVLGGQLK
jgi:hypothetical protein